MNELFGAPTLPVPTPPATIPVTVAPKPPVPTPPVPQAVVAPKPPTLAVPGTLGVQLFVDVMVERGPNLLPLDSYFAEHLRSLEAQFGVVDIRIAAKDSPLAFGGWKGALAAKCKAALPPPGRYFVRSSDDISAVVVDAIAPLCAAVYRGR
jgi:hypothetical protein